MKSIDYIYTISLFLVSAIFFSLLFGYIGMLNWMYILPLSVITTYILNKKLTAGKNDKKAYFFAFIFILPLLVIQLIFGLIPEQSSDVYSRLSKSKLWSEEGRIISNQINGFPYGAYPSGMDAFMAFLIQPFQQYFVLIEFIFSIFITYLSLVAIYKLTKYITKKESIVPLFFYGLCITTFWIIEQGYFSFLFGSFFFLMFLLAIKEYETNSDKRFLALASIFIAGTLMVYPHFGFLSLIFIILSRNKKYYKAFFVGLLISLVETVPLGLGNVIDSSSDADVHLIASIAGLGIIQGGILVPNVYIILSIFLSVLFGLKDFFRNKEYSFLRKWVFTYLIFFGFVLITFFVNKFVDLRPDNETINPLKEFYMIVKMFYFLLAPVSIIAFIGFKKIKESKHKISKLVCYSIILYHLVFSLCYVTFLITKGTAFPIEFYNKLDYLRNELKGTVFSIEDCLVNKTEIERPSIFAPLIDLPSDWNPIEDKMQRLYKLFISEKGKDYNITISVDKSKEVTLYACNGIRIEKN